MEWKSFATQQSIALQHPVYGLVLDANLKEEESLASPLCGAPSAAPTQFVQSIIDANGDFAGAQPSSNETCRRSLLFMFGSAVTVSGEPDPPQAASKPNESRPPAMGLMHRKYCKAYILFSSFGVEIHSRRPAGWALRSRPSSNSERRRHNVSPLGYLRGLFFNERMPDRVSLFWSLWREIQVPSTLAPL
jgi:hypothetical protein